MQNTLAFFVIPVDFLQLAFGEMVFLTGVFACILYALRRRRSDRAELYIGLAALLYGSRLIAGMNILGNEFPGFPGNAIQVLTTLFVGIPFVLFVGCTLLPAHSWLVRVVVSAQSLLAAAGILTWLAGANGNMEIIWYANGIMGITIAIALPFIAFFVNAPRSPELRVLRIGLVILAVFVFNQNMISINLPGIRGNWEPIGMLIYLGTFGYVGLARALRTEQSWIAVHKELEIARDIQTGLLPAPDAATGQLRAFARYVPAASVAGDFYDLLLDSGCLGALVADVSGHGVPAALSASMMKVALKTQRERMNAPADMLAALNTVLNGSLHGQFITAAYVFFDPAQRSLRYAGAGHPPIFILRGENAAVEQLEENGLFLGPFPMAQYHQLASSFQPGDRCLLYTDGVVEAANPQGEEFGADRLRTFLAANHSLSGDAMCDSLLAGLAAWTGAPGGNPADDVTLLLVEFPV